MPKTANHRRVIFTAAAKLAVVKADATATPAEKIATLTGYALLWNVLSTDRGGFKVRLLPNSATFATPTLALFHHDYTLPIGNTANGTLRLMPDEIGVKVEIDLPDTGAGRDVEELVENGYMTGFSFAMVDAPEGKKVTENGQTILNASKYTVDEITVTMIPAFPTVVELAEDDEPEDEAGDDDASFTVRREQSLRLQRFKFDLCRLPREQSFPVASAATPQRPAVRT